MIEAALYITSLVTMVGYIVLSAKYL